MWWKMSKEFFNFSNDNYVCSTYIPPSNSSREKNVQKDNFRILNETITKYRNLGKVILCGDFNSRVGILPDFISEKNKILTLTYAMNLPRIPHQEYLRTKISILMVENLLRPVFHTILGLPMVESMVIV